jgi:hypothetical protein
MSRLPNTPLRKARSNNAFFIHIPKAGGTSVKKSLYPKSLTKYQYGHLTYKDIIEIYGQEKVDSIYKFTFVRNPWDRVYSGYRFLAQGGMDLIDRALYSLGIAKYDTFEEFVYNWLSKENIYGKVHKYIHFYPQFEFLTNDADKIAVDFIGKVENMESDYNKIREKIGFGKSLKHLNRTPKTKKFKEDYRNAYTNDMIDIVAKVYKRDIEEFGYSFDK